MKIVYLTLSNIETVHKKGIYTDLVREFVKNGDEVTIISPYERRYGKQTQFIHEKNVDILKVKIGNITKTKKIEKGISTLSIDFFYLKAIKKYLKDTHFDLILYSTPPITFLKSIKYLKHKNECPTYLMLKDIFPQNAVDLEMISQNGFLHKYFLKKEKDLYEISDYIGCMSHKNVEYINAHNSLDKRKLHILPNAISLNEKHDKTELNNELYKKYRIPKEKYIFIYGGNIGKPQNVDFLVDNLERIEKEIPDVFFLIIGSGTEFERLKQRINSLKSDNCIILNQVPVDEYDKLVSLSDVGVIMLDYRFTIPNFPSRLLSYMEYSKPVLCITDSATDVGRIAEKNKFGIWAPSNDSEKLISSIRSIINIDLKEYGTNGFNYLKENYTVEKSYKIIKSNLKRK